MPAGFFSIANLGIEARQIAHTQRRHQLVALVHFADTPIQSVARLAHVRDHGRQQMRNVFVDRQLEHLRIDQNHAYVTRFGFVDQREDHRVDAHRFTRTSSACHQQMRHLRQIGHHWQAADVLAQRDRQRRIHIVIRLRPDDL